MPLSFSKRTLVVSRSSSACSRKRLRSLSWLLTLPQKPLSAPKTSPLKCDIWAILSSKLANSDLYASWSLVERTMYCHSVCARCTSSSLSTVIPAGIKVSVNDKSVAVCVKPSGKAIVAPLRQSFTICCEKSGDAMPSGKSQVCTLLSSARSSIAIRTRSFCSVVPHKTNFDFMLRDKFSSKKLL